MNPYLSSHEKENLIRVLVMYDAICNVIEAYSRVKSTDKTLLADLRHAKTRIQKAVQRRVSFLDEQAKYNLMLAVDKIEFMFVPKPEVKKRNEELLRLKSTLPMHVDDFYDWYSFVIDHTCLTCQRTDYEECPARRVLMKYEVTPYNPGAVGSCQYSYVQPDQGLGTVGEALLAAMNKGA
ncbi:hypothetical protein SCACP_21570 [Sporomusa carbonis]|uniref:DUF5651 domain-containing protein n=1 Tax=Sporomusa carbonis TaxID=3076075 RepID=UPI003A6878A0